MKRKLLSLMLILIMSIFGLVFIITCTDANGSAGIGGSFSSGANSSSSITSTTSSTASSSSSAASSSSSVASSSSSTVSSSSSSVTAGLLDNFDDGNDSNLMGGTNGEWGDDGGNHTYDSANAYGGSGYALKAAYTVTATAVPGVSDTWFAPELGIGTSYKNVSGYANLTFYIKKDSSTTKAYLKVCIKDNDGTPHESQLPVTNYITSITDTYQLVTVPLSAFSGVTLTNLLYVFFNINYTDLTANSCPTTGIVYIDEIQFSGTASSSSASSTSSVSSGSTLIFSMDDTSGITFDFTPATITLDTTLKVEGTGSVAFNPDGLNNELKPIFPITTTAQANALTTGGTLSVQIYIPTGYTPAITHVFFQRKISGGGFDWIDGLFSITPTTGAWNTFSVTLSGKTFAIGDGLEIGIGVATGSNTPTTKINYDNVKIQ